MNATDPTGELAFVLPAIPVVLEATVITAGIGACIFFCDDVVEAAAGRSDGTLVGDNVVSDTIENVGNILHNEGREDDNDSNKPSVPADTAGTPPGGPDDDDHFEQRRREARGGDASREVGDPNRVLREGRRFIDSETGHIVYVRGDRVVVLRPDGRPVTQFRNSRANTQKRIREGRWIPQ